MFLKLIYVRFGEIPTNGKSKNYLTGEYEKGVSVYEAVEKEDGSIYILMPELTGNACVSLSGVLDRPAYVVEGDKVGIGSDNEPILRNCRIIRKLNQIGCRGW